MSANDPDIDVLMDTLERPLWIAMAQEFLHRMQDHNPNVPRCEAIIGMLVGVMGRVPQEAHDKFTPALQVLSSQWAGFCDSINSRGAPFALSPELTRILKTMSFMELEAAFDKSDVTSREDMIHHSWKIPYAIDRAKGRAAYFGPSECMSLDIAHDEMIAQLQTRYADLLVRIQHSTGPQPKPPQP